MKHRLTFAGKKFIRMGDAASGRKPGDLSSDERVALRPASDQRGRDGAWVHEPGTGGKPESLLGYGHPGGRAVSRVAGKCPDRRPGRISSLTGSRCLRWWARGCPARCFLLLTAWLLSGILGLALGVLSGAFRGRLPDRLIRGYCLVISSTPAFWLAILLLLIFSVWLGWLPVGLSVPAGMEAQAVTALDRLRHAVLPALTLSITGVANIALHTREKLVDVLESDYVLFARARGESWRSIVLRHGLRNVLLPAITLQFASVSEIIGGSVLVEQVFSYPGLGQAAVEAGLGSDLPLLLGITVITAAIVFLGNLIADLLYGVVDPRIRRGAARE